MQDIHAIGGGGGGAGPGGRLFAGGSAGADRRLRPHHNQNHHQALKCPRCDSLNTKFCYYNNYNLSQPRHFCKSCRRYWTKGGVLRNVPVGGGCRKTKRSKPKQTASTDQVAAAEAATPAPGERNSNSHSSSESSSLTATTTSAKKAPPAGSTGEVASATVNSSNSGSNLMNFTDSRFFLPQMNPNGSFEHHQQLIDPAGTSEGQIFTEMGSFTSLMTASSNDPAMLGFTNMPTADISGYRLQQSHPGSVLDNQSSSQMVGTAAGSDELKMEQINCEFLDQTAQIGFSGLQQNRISNGGLSGLDWQINGGGGGGDGGGGEQGLFDFTGTVDQAYWGQNQWADNDQSLNFPPLV